MAVRIALLRAVNVAGRVVPMADLRAMLARMRLGHVRTLLQSGNVVFESGEPPAALEARLEAQAARSLGLETEFFVRTPSEWEAALAANPFPKEAKDDPSHLVVMTLKSAPGAAQAEALRAAVVGREKVAVVGRHAYLVYPDGIGRSKLTNALAEARLGTRGTARNWNTAQKLAALARGG